MFSFCSRGNKKIMEDIKKIAFWSTNNRFNKILNNIGSIKSIDPYFFCRENISTFLPSQKNVFKIDKYDFKKVCNLLNENKINTIFMSHIDKDFLELYAGKKIYLSHGFFDFSPEIIFAKDCKKHMNKFDKILAPGLISKNIMIKHFNVPHEKNLNNIYLPFDNLFNENNIFSNNIKKDITIIDHGLRGSSSVKHGIEYNNRFFKILPILSEFCDNNCFTLNIKLKVPSTRKFIEENILGKKILSKSNTNIVDTLDDSYLKNTQLLVIIRSPSLEIESMCCNIPTIIIRDEDEDYNGAIKHGAIFNISKDKIDYKIVNDMILNIINKKLTINKEKYLSENDIIFDNQNIVRLADFINNEC